MLFKNGKIIKCVCTAKYKIVKFKEKLTYNDSDVFECKYCNNEIFSYSGTTVHQCIELKGPTL